MFGGWARNDLAEYRAHYPNNLDDMTKSDNVKFYRNEIPLRPENKTIEEVHEKWYGDWEWLEYCHSYIQWLFPIQESGLNWQAQVLQKHEIATMKSDPQVLRRVLKSFELMLDFYGFEIVVLSDSTSSGATASSSAFAKSEDAAIAGGKQQNQDSSSSSTLAALNPQSKVRIRRISDPERGFQKQFHNLNVSSHNYLRITRMLKFLGEMGLEHLKLEWLACFEREIFAEKEGEEESPSLLYNCADSYERYWIGTIYDDDLREAAEQRAKIGCAKARELKEKAWQARYGSLAGARVDYFANRNAQTQSTTTAIDKKEVEDETSGIRVITDFGSRDNSSAMNNNGNDDETNSTSNNTGKVQKAEDYVFVMNSSDMETATGSNVSGGARAESGISNNGDDN